MADFSSLKQTIQSYIKQNGNEEITGNILQDVLLAMVSTMGDSAINSLASALQDEITARQNQDATLQGNIAAETTERQQADTALGGRIDGLQTAINGINTKLAEGYMYAGIATPSTNPGTPSGKVFYIAVQAGTYTNFGGTVVTEGITILKYNGSAWSSDQIIAVDDEPIAGSNNPVKSGGVYKGLDDVLEKSLEFVKKEVSEPIGSTVINGIPGSDGFFVDGTGFESLLYNISDVNYADIVLKTGNNNALLTFLKSMPVVNSLMDTSDNIIRHTAAANSVVEFKIPYGTKYIVIDNRTAFQVQSVSFLGVEGNINDYLQKSEIETGVISENIANPAFVIDGKYVSGTGVIGDEAGWTVIKLPVEVGKRYTFAGFVINRTNNNYAFYNNDTLVLKNQYSPNENPVYTTEATPTGANYLYMTIKSDSAGSNYNNLQVNEGTELKPYDEYKEGIVKIAGYAIEGTGGSGTIDSQSLIADLPVSDGTDISVGYAYIDSNTNVVKVKVL